MLKYKLFKRPESSKWQVLIKLPTGNKVLSTKCKNPQDAELVARNIVQHYEDKINSALGVNKTFQSEVKAKGNVKLSKLADYYVNTYSINQNLKGTQTTGYNIRL